MSQRPALGATAQVWLTSLCIVKGWDPVGGCWAFKSCFPSPMLCVIALPPGTMLFPIARQSRVVLYRRCRRRRGVHRYELRRVNVAFDSRPSMAASLRAVRVHILPDGFCGSGVFGTILFGTREVMCAIWNAGTSRRPNMAMCRWLRTGAIRHFIGGGGRCLSTVGCCRRR